MIKHEAKEITPEEARHLFLKHMAAIVRYWEHESRAVTSKDKLEGLIFSVMAALDGCAAGLTAYRVTPIDNAEDEIRYAKDEGFDYYPAKGADIAGSLHDNIHKYLEEGKAPKFENLYDFGAFLADEAKKFLNPQNRNSNSK